jgi:ABC-type dipeptide/oligopeptide/nickel transport system ATPase component
VDDLLSLLTNVFLVLPGLPLAIVLATYLPPGPLSLTAVLAFAGWSWNARVFRSQAISLRQRDFVLAAIVSGESHWRIIVREMLPNMISLVAAAFIGATIYAVGAQVGLEFLGLGDVGAVTWGTNLYWAANDSALMTGSWWIFVPTGLGVALVGFGLTFVNFGIDEFNNPRLRVNRFAVAQERVRPEVSAASDLALAVTDLVVEYPSGEGCFRAVDGVSLTVTRGEIVGLAGESGSGKSTIALAILGLLSESARVARGSIRVGATEVLDLDEPGLRAFRWARVSMCFQSAMNALNPVLTVREQLLDGIAAHRAEGWGSAAEGDATVAELLAMVGIEASHAGSFPHQLSGGMRQRVVLAMALSLEPELLILDEPTTALDVVVQKEILQRVNALRLARGFGVLFITHDMPLLLEVADRVAVLQRGRLLDVGTAAELRGGSVQAYTAQLMHGVAAVQAAEVEA